MKKFKVFETFSGIGAQHQALENLKNNNDVEFDYDVVGISDWDMYAVQSYAAMHCSKKMLSEKEPSDEQLKEFIEANWGSFSADGKKPENNISRFKDFFLNNLYKSFNATNNLGTIVDSFERVVDKIFNDPEKGSIDLLTYSFPCQDLSTAGNFHGFNEGIKKHTRSGLLYEIEKLIKSLKDNRINDKGNLVKATKSDNLLPKFLLLENVVNLVQSQHKKDFYRWLKELESIGYKTIWGIVNANDFGLFQARRRVFALSIFDPENKLHDFDDNWVDGQNIREDLSNELLEIYNNEFKPSWIQKDVIDDEILFDFKNKYEEESWLCQMKKTKSRIMMKDKGHTINLKSLKERGKVNTITTKQDRWPNAGHVKGVYRKPGKDGIQYMEERFFTPRETYRLMGFKDDKFEKAKETMEKLCVSKVAARDKLYKQAGNSIAVNALEMIFYYMNKIEREVK